MAKTGRALFEFMTNELLNVNKEKRRELSREHGKVVDEVRFHEGGVCCDIYLDKDSMVFTAEISEQRFCDAEGHKVKAWAREQLKRVCALTWLPVISVLDVGEGGRSREYHYSSRRLELHEISIDVYRFYVAQLANGGVRAVDWDTPPEKRLTSHCAPPIWVRGEDRLKIEGGRVQALHEDNIHILPYTEDLWAGLQQLCKGIDALSKKLHQLIKSDDGLLKLQNVGAGVLRLLNDAK